MIDHVKIPYQHASEYFFGGFAVAGIAFTSFGFSATYVAASEQDEKRIEKTIIKQTDGKKKVIVFSSDDDIDINMDGDDANVLHVKKCEGGDALIDETIEDEKGGKVMKEEEKRAQERRARLIGQCL